jgi:hypothetical protein
MSEKISNNDIAIWNELVENYKRYVLTQQAFFRTSIDRVALIRRALHTSDRFIAVSIAQYLSPAEHMQLFDEWVRWSRAEGCLPAVRNYILSLPREWVMERIEQAVEPYLRDNVEEDFRRYLELYYILDRGLTLKLAWRASKHPNEEIQEAGKDFLSKLEDDQAHERD